MNSVQYQEKTEKFLEALRIPQLQKNIKELIDDLAIIRSWELIYFCRILIKAKGALLEELKNQRKEVNEK
jgi:hypothetical protein